MGLIPETRALLGVDVIGSGSNPGYHRARLGGALSGLLSGALDASRIPEGDVVHDEPTGDGAIYTFPSRYLGAVVDLSKRLDDLAAKHNRRNKPEIRLRIAVHVGPVGDQPEFCSAKKDLVRLLEADAFKKLVRTCIQQRADAYGNSLVNSGLIVSTAAFQAVFGGDYTDEVQESDFLEMMVSNKEFTGQAWVRVPGVDPDILNEFAGLAQAAQLDEQDSASWPAKQSSPRVTNHVGGNMTGSQQAGVVYGDMSSGWRR